jgi:hypothetical protein
VFRHWRIGKLLGLPSLSFLAGNETKSPPEALHDSDFPDDKTVVEANGRVGFDQVLAWINSNFRNLHAQSTVTASTRRVTFSNDLAF